MTKKLIQAISQHSLPLNDMSLTKMKQLNGLSPVKFRTQAVSLYPFLIVIVHAASPTCS